MAATYALPWEILSSSIGKMASQWEKNFSHWTHLQSQMSLQYETHKDTDRMWKSLRFHPQLSVFIVLQGFPSEGRGVAIMKVIIHLMVFIKLFTALVPVAKLNKQYSLFKRSKDLSGRYSSERGRQTKREKECSVFVLFIFKGIKSACFVSLW